MSNPPYTYNGRKNDYPGACARCGGDIGAKEGLLVTDEGTGKWAVLHLDCAPRNIQEQAQRDFAESSPFVTFGFRPPADLVIVSGGRLSDEAYNAMKLITNENTRWDRGDRINVAPLNRTAEIHSMFEEAGIEVSVSEKLANALQTKQTDTNQAIDLAQHRAENVDQILADMGAASGREMSLYEFQREGIGWLASRRKALLADDQGLGKTIQAATAIPDGAPVVVVVPVVVMGNWRKELANWRPEREEAIELGAVSASKKTGRKKIAAKDSFQRWPLPGETFITSYSRLPAYPPGDPHPGTVLICDEAHNLKTLRIWNDAPDEKKSSIRAANFWRMSQAVIRSGGIVWLLTGTPIMNKATELWSVLQQADMETEVFGSWSNFKAEYNVDEYEEYGRRILEWGEPSPNVPILLQRVMLRREKEDVLKDLPPKSYQDIVVGIDQEAEEELAKIEESVLSALAPEEGDPAKLLDEDLELLRVQEEVEKIQSGQRESKLDEHEKEILEKTKNDAPGFQGISQAREILARAKIPALEELVVPYEEAGEPLIVFSAHLAPLRILAKRPGWVIIEGKTKPAERTRIVERFQAGEIVGIAASIKAAGVGITLTRANTAIFLDRDWTPSANVQAEDRIYRIGQFRPVTIINLIADHAIDERVAALLREKEILIKATISAGKRLEGEVHLEPVSLVGASGLRRITKFDLAASGLAVGPADPEQARAEREREKERERQERETEKKQPTPAQLSELDIRRLAENADEEWLVSALLYLVEADQDHAALLNDMGFNQADSGYGHQFSALIQMGYGLTESEWDFSLDMIQKYRGQVGLPPSASDAELAEAIKAQRRTKQRQERTRAKQAGEFAKGEWALTPDGPGVVIGKLKGKGPTIYNVQLRGGDQNQYAKEILQKIDGPEAEPTEESLPVPVSVPAPKKIAKKKRTSKRRPKIADGVFYARTVTDNMEEGDFDMEVITTKGGKVVDVNTRWKGSISSEIVVGMNTSALEEWAAYESPEGQFPHYGRQVWTDGGWTAPHSVKGIEAVMSEVAPEDVAPEETQDVIGQIVEAEWDRGGVAPAPDEWAGEAEQTTFWNPPPWRGWTR